MFQVMCQIIRYSKLSHLFRDLSIWIKRVKIIKIIKCIRTLSSLNLFYDSEEITRECHTKYHYDGHYDSAQSKLWGIATHKFSWYLQTTAIKNGRWTWIVSAGLSLVSISLLTTWLWDSSLPIVVTLYSATSQFRLCVIPSSCDFSSSTIELHAGEHFLSHSRCYFFTEHISQNATQQHRYKYQEKQDGILKKTRKDNEKIE